MSSFLLLISIFLLVVGHLSEFEGLDGLVFLFFIESQEADNFTSACCKGIFKDSCKDGVSENFIRERTLQGEQRYSDELTFSFLGFVFHSEGFRTSQISNVKSALSLRGALTLGDLELEDVM